MSEYKGIQVYKLNAWTQGPALLQTLNILENFDLKSMGYNSARYIHTLYQAMNLAFADRDFYYGDTYFPPEEPVRGLLSKDYAKARAKLIDPARNDPNAKPGDPYPYQGGTNPFKDLLDRWGGATPTGSGSAGSRSFDGLGVARPNAMRFPSGSVKPKAPSSKRGDGFGSAGGSQSRCASRASLEGKAKPKEATVLAGPSRTRNTRSGPVQCHAPSIAKRCSA